MNSSNPPKKSLTAIEVASRSDANPRSLARKEEAERRRRESAEQHRISSLPVITELREAGFSVQSVDDLRRTGLAYKDAVPILLKWLPLADNVRVKESIVRSLSVPWAKPAAALPLVKEFRRASDSGGSGLKWTIGNALEVVADDSVFEPICELVRDKKHGKAREMLAVSLGNMKDPRATDVLIELLDDAELTGHALIGLGKLGAESARLHIEPLLNYPKTWVRREAIRTLAKLDKRVDSHPKNR